MKLKHSFVAYGEDLFFAWPANNGMWRFGDELFVGFSEGRHKYNGHGFHAFDHDFPLKLVFARLTPGGQWELERPELPGVVSEPPLYSGKLNPGSAGEGLYFSSSGVSGEATSWFYVTSDGGRTWTGPWRVPDFGMKGVAMRTDYIVSDGSYILGMTGVKPDGEEGTAFAAKLDSDGQWSFLGHIGGPLPKGEFRIMPSLAKLPSGRLVALTRRAAETDDDVGRSQIECFVSDDGGRLWSHTSDLCVAEGDASGGSPAALCTTKDGTVFAVFCRRAEPRGIYLSSTRDGLHWSAPIPLRTSQGNTDIGYPRVAVRDNSLYAVYYYNFGEEEPRFIECAEVELP